MPRQTIQAMLVISRLDWCRRHGQGDGGDDERCYQELAGRGQDTADAADLFHGNDQQGEADGAQETADQAPRQAVGLNVGAIDAEDADRNDDHGAYFRDRKGLMEDEVRQDHNQDGPAVAHEGCQADADMLVGFVEEEPVPGQEEARQDQPDQGRAGRAAQAAPFAAGRRQDEQEKTAQDRTGQDDFITRQGNMAGDDTVRAENDSSQDEFDVRIFHERPSFEWMILL